MNHKVTIITPSYNSAEYISETIDSVIKQTYENWEMLIVDDCSKDDSVAIINDYCLLDNRVRLIQLEKNGGAAVARNRAIKEAQGRFLAFLDSDDQWHPKKLEKQVGMMVNKNIPFTFTSYQLVSEEGELGRIIKSKAEVSYRNAIMSNPIGCLTVVIDIDFFGKVYMPLIKKRQDLGLWLKLLRKTNAIGIDENLALYRVRKDSISSNKFKLVKYHWILYREHEKTSFLKSIYYVLYYSVSKLLNILR
ncbi:glycosyltransferase family 2 protein [Aquimarina litoralis]|uniref:Glycosyltransferase family 2 protein n=1 Tax=Aquimarina litoralis TaxID=584605 RepID=A0ABN1II76_9FLAO